MTRLITAEEIPQLIKDEMVKDLSHLISKKQQLNGRSLMYIEGATNNIYMMYLIKNATNIIEEIYFVSNDIIMDYRKPSKSLVSLEFLQDL